MSQSIPKLVNCFTLALLVLFVSAQPQAMAAPPDRVDVLIGFKQAPGANDLAFIRGQGGRIKYTYQIVSAVAANVPQQALAGLANNPNVAVVELDGTVQAVGVETTNAWGVAQIGADYAHGLGWTGTAIRVAVIDSGIDYTHPEFAGNYAGGHDFVNDDEFPFDDNGHGTHCAGTIGAVANPDDDVSNPFGVIGVAPNVSIYSYKVLDAGGSGSFSNIIAALEQCVLDKINVTSNSYGSSINPGGIVEQAFINTDAAGILNVAAAGNSGNPRGKGNNVIYPAAYDSALAVAATDSNDDRAYFSSTGPDVELAAPGYLVYSTVPGGGYAYYSGTSMACPHVAGAAALMIGASGLDNHAVRDLLDLSAVDKGAAGRDNQYGYGRVDIPMALDLLDGGGGGGGGEEPPAGEDLMMKVASIGYSTTGGPNQNKDVIISVTIEESVLQIPVANASVSILGYHDGLDFGSATGTTDSSGVVRFRVRNAPSGTYSIDVTAVSATGYLWDEISPFNSYNKQP